LSDPAAVQAICDRLGPDDIDGLLRKWLARLPHPFSPADRDAGYLTPRSSSTTIATRGRTR